MNRITDLGRGIYRLTTEFDGGSVHTYAVMGEKLAVIDTGTADTIDLIKELYEKLGCPETEIVLHTHGHWDHIGAARQTKELTGAPLGVHGDDAAMMGSRAENDKRFLAAFPEDFEPTQPEIDVVEDNIGNQIPPDEIVKPGDKFDLGGRTLAAVPIPGHTSGCLAFLDDLTNTLFTGDGMCGIGSIGYLVQYEDVQGYLDSVERVRSLKPSCILCGHFDPFDTPEAIDKFLDECESEVRKVNESVKKLAPKYDDLNSLVRAVCADLGKPFILQPFFTVTAHLEHIKRK
ncbi:MAG: MBL fold metallo-hydrolase [Abditibacteriota bacterium]|nr:MBL fold metallo-hydrolase [Abditibacteriota bacterium]